jgi:hypothetical protein
LTQPAPGDLALALSEGFQEATAEKVWRLVDVLRELQAHASTKNRLVLKGGTALNVFHLPTIPRLSVDLDLMATGFKEAAPDTTLRRELIGEIQTILRKMGYEVGSTPSGAACTFHVRYRNALGSAARVQSCLHPSLGESNIKQGHLTDPGSLDGDCTPTRWPTDAEPSRWNVTSVMRPAFPDRPHCWSGPGTQLTTYELKLRLSISRDALARLRVLRDGHSRG